MWVAGRHQSVSGEYALLKRLTLTHFWPRAAFGDASVLCSMNHLYRFPIWEPNKTLQTPQRQTRLFADGQPSRHPGFETAVEIVDFEALITHLIHGFG